MRAIADELIVCTDDGSYGRKALVTEPLKELCERTPKPDLAVAIGPPIMMKFCAETTRPFGVPTVVSLNTIMVDGTGMCGGCRVTVGGETKFVCVDGPEFDGHQVDFDNMMKRLGAYKQHEDAGARAVPPARLAAERRTDGRRDMSHTTARSSWPREAQALLDGLLAAQAAAEAARTALAIPPQEMPAQDRRPSAAAT